MHSAASESMESPVVRHVINNAPGSSNFLSKVHIQQDNVVYIM